MEGGGSGVGENESAKKNEGEEEGGAAVVTKDEPVGHNEVSKDDRKNS
jgi:hypothetical protein